MEDGKKIPTPSSLEDLADLLVEAVRKRERENRLGELPWLGGKSAEQLEKFIRRTALRKIILTPSGCWVAHREPSNSGPRYSLRVGSACMNFNRLLWELTNGPIDSSHSLWNQCGTVLCVNPLHHWVPTRLERLADRFWPNVCKRGPNECWEWTGWLDKKTKRGYVGYRGEGLIASRVAWELHYGEPPGDGLFVCHSCDNPTCVNINHLWLGTQSDNIRDCARKGRMHFQRHPEASAWSRNDGSRIPASRFGSIHAARAKDLRMAGASYPAIAAELGCGVTTARLLVAA